jgi:hypothetical protein
LIPASGIEPALDGGLFLMSFLLALESQGLASCCLNFCVGPQTDRWRTASAISRNRKNPHVPGHRPSP